MAKLLWEPSRERVEATNMYRFMQEVNKNHGKDFTSYDALYRWSVEAPAEFWPAVWKFVGHTREHPMASGARDGGEHAGEPLVCG